MNFKKENTFKFVVLILNKINMKKIFLTAAAVFALSFANAQDKKAASTGFGYAKGDFVLGGNIMFGSTSSDNGVVKTKTSTSTIGPDAAYFVSDKFAVELGLNFGNTSTDNGTTTTKDATTNIMIGGRYYFLDLGQRFKTYTNFGLNFGSNNNGGNGADKTSTFGLGAGLGINYFATQNIAINFGLGNILSYTSSKTGSVKDNGFNLNLNEFQNFFSTPTFGVSYKF